MNKTKVNIIGNFKQDLRVSMDNYTQELSSFLNESNSFEPNVIQLKLSSFSNAIYQYNFLKKNVMRFERYYAFKKSLSNINKNQITHISDHNYAHFVNQLESKINILTVHDLIPIVFSEKLKKNPFLLKYSLSNLYKFNRIISVSNNTKKDILKFTNCPENKITVLHRAIEDFFNSTKIDKVLICKKYSIPINDVKILLTGNGFYKNHKTSLKALERISDILPNFKIIKIGSSEELKTNKKLQNKIIDLPYLSRLELSNIYKICDVLLFPSMYEGFGMPLLEAMKSSVPIVTSNNSSIPEVVENAALISDYDDDRQMSNNIITIIKNSKLRQDLINKGLKQSNKFDIDYYHASLQSVYKEEIEKASYIEKKPTFLFIKKLENLGGAERLIVNELDHLNKLNKNSHILTAKYENKAIYEKIILKNRILSMNSNNFLTAFIKFFFTILRYKPKNIIVTSGLIEIYILSIFFKFNIFIHYHHPASMSYNDYIKYSMFMKKHFNYFVTKSTNGEYFKHYKHNLNYIKMLLINLKSYFILKCLNKSKGVFVLSEFAKQECQRYVSSKIYNLKGAFNENFLDNIKLNSKIYKSDQNKLLVIARLDVNKRVDVIIKSMQLLNEEGYDYLSLDIVGDGPEYNNLNNLIKNNRLFNCHIYKNLNDAQLNNKIINCNVFITIDWGDYTLTSMEALAYGKKIVVSYDAKFDKKIEENSQIFYTEPQPVSLSRTIKKAIKTKTNNNFSNNYLKEYTWENYINQISTVVYK